LTPLKKNRWNIPHDMILNIPEGYKLRNHIVLGVVAILSKLLFIEGSLEVASPNWASIYCKRSFSMLSWTHGIIWNWWNWCIKDAEITVISQETPSDTESAIIVKMRTFIPSFH